MDVASLAASIDQTLLSPLAGPGETRRWIEQHRGAGFAALCVAPCHVPLAARLLEGSGTRVCSVAGFPLGYSLTATKAAEAKHLVEKGCAEVDMVVNIGALLEGDFEYVRGDITEVTAAVAAASGGAAAVKVILETGYLETAAIEAGCRLAEEAGADYVKTSTGFGPRGASVEDVDFMRRSVGSRLGVKASGGVRDLDSALALLKAGADRIGTSSGPQLLAQARARGM